LKCNPRVNEKTSIKEYYSWDEIRLLAKIVSDKVIRSKKKYDIILGITNGGIIPARLIAQELNVVHILFIPVRYKKLIPNEMPKLDVTKEYLVVDDIYDTGNIFSKVHNALCHLHCDYAFLMKRYDSIVENKPTVFTGKILNHEKWIVFPWE
jgi:hypoxanthine phosphoribosyltransferase